MPVSGWVLTLSTDETQREAALAALRADPRLTLGEPMGLNLPLALDTERVAEDRALVDAIRDLPGVSMMALVFLDFADAEEATDGWSAGRRLPHLETPPDALEV